jgi:hypothetical protein
MPEAEVLKSTLQNNQHYAELCTIAVFIGLLIEYLPELLKWKKHSKTERTALIAGLVLIAGGVFGEYLFGSWAGEAALKLQAHADEEVAHLNNEAAQARKDAETFRKQAADLIKQAEDERLARLKVERQTALRDISPDQMSKLAAKLAPFAGQPVTIDVFPVNWENAALGNSIMALLVGAKWKAARVNYLSAPATHSLANDPSIPGGPFMQAGVWVQATGDDKSQAARRSLVEALDSTEAKVNSGPSPLHDLPNDLIEPRVWIYVGDRPTPFRSWVK